jgi:hypothetical protein
LIQETGITLEAQINASKTMSETMATKNGTTKLVSDSCTFYRTPPVHDSRNNYRSPHKHNNTSMKAREKNSGISSTQEATSTAELSATNHEQDKAIERCTLDSA